MTKTVHDSETAAQGQQVISACALIHHEIDGERRVFVARRAATKRFLPGVYEIPGGHIDYAEHVKDGLAREIREEFEVDIAIGDPFYVFDYTNDVKGSHSLEVVYFARLKDCQPEDIVLHPEDHDGFLWLAAGEIEKVYTVTKGADDEEVKALRRAFAILAGASFDLG